MSREANRQIQAVEQTRTLVSKGVSRSSRQANDSNSLTTSSLHERETRTYALAYVAASTTGTRIGRLRQ